MHKQHPQTAYRKAAVLIGTIFENCDKIKSGPPAAPKSAAGGFLYKRKRDGRSVHDKRTDDTRFI
jgi:hypothetical protein